jgi:hypothetical protein
MFGRPSNREKYNKVSEAISAIECGNCARLLTKHISMDDEAMGVDDEDEFWAVLAQLLKEVITAGPVKHYAGGHPPQRSYEAELKDKELWAYAWDSEILGKRMYVKFCTTKGYYFHVDCHESQPK